LGSVLLPPKGEGAALFEQGGQIRAPGRSPVLARQSQGSGGGHRTGDTDLGPGSLGPLASPRAPRHGDPGNRARSAGSGTGRRRFAHAPPAAPGAAPPSSPAPSSVEFPRSCHRRPPGSPGPAAP